MANVSDRVIVVGVCMYQREPIGESSPFFWGLFSFLFLFFEHQAEQSGSFCILTLNENH